MKLTATTIRTLALPEGVRDRTYFDDDLPRFGIRMRAGGSARWVVQYAIGRKERRVVLGPVSALDPGKARALAKDLLARVRLGEDPLAAKHEAAVRSAETLGALLPRYLAFQAREPATALLHRDRAPSARARKAPAQSPARRPAGRSPRHRAPARRNRRSVRTNCCQHGSLKPLGVLRLACARGVARK
jgi:Arm domain-containing DNA-binding protein